MVCPVCRKDNKSDAKFCKHCGAAIGQKYKTCKNGHNYDSSLNECPYCPKKEVLPSIKTSTASQKTVIDKQEEFPTATEIKNKKSNVVKSSVAISPTPKTELNKHIGSQTTSENQSQNKLVGWLVSFDFDQYGTDFKLYEGRTKIGSGDYCTVVIKDASVSEEHSLLFYRDKKLLLQDELSTNGTFVNGKRIDERTLVKDGDSIKLGNISFKIKII